eukprot:1195937-Prorocentrum_minimum.AAC.5
MSNLSPNYVMFGRSPPRSSAPHNGPGGSYPDWPLVFPSREVKRVESKRYLRSHRFVATLTCSRSVWFLQTEPLQRALSDQHAYVRRTAVTAVLKVYDLDKTVITDLGLLDTVRGIALSDRDAQVCSFRASRCLVFGNPRVWSEKGLYELAMHWSAVLEIRHDCLAFKIFISISLVITSLPLQVAINALSVLAEVEGKESLANAGMLIPLLNRVKELDEWGLCLVMEIAALYVPKEPTEIFDIMNVLESCLGHVNSAVVLATVRVFLRVTLSMAEVHQQVLSGTQECTVTNHQTLGFTVPYLCEKLAAQQT